MKPAKIAKYKKKIVEDFARLIREYPIIAAVDMENLPAPQLQKMRSQLRDMMVLKMAKRRLIRIAIEQAKKDKKEIGKIEPYLTGMPALLFTKENPFKLYKILGKSKSSAPAKAGQTAPFDIVIPAGPTPFAPGPIIGELGMLGIKTSVEGGKVAVASDSVVVKEGEVIKPKVAELLTRFNIEPMEIGLNITAVYEDGTIYKKDVLGIDEDAFLKQLQDAHTWAFNLAVEAGYYTKEVVETIIPKAFNEAKALAKEANIMCDLIAEELVEQAERSALSLKAEAKIPETAKENKKPEPKPIEEKSKPEPVKEEAKITTQDTPKKEAVKEPEKKETKQEIKVEEAKPEPAKEKLEKIEEEIKETKQEIKKIEKKKQEEKKEEIKEEVEKIEEEIKEELKKPEPSEEKIKEIEKEVEVVEKEIMQKEPDLPKQAEKEIDEIERELEKSEEKKPTEDEFAAKLDTENIKQKQEHIESENLFKELKKKGTLREIKEKEAEKPKENLSPQDIIEQHKKKLEGDKS